MEGRREEEGKKERGRGEGQNNKEVARAIYTWGSQDKMKM